MGEPAVLPAVAVTEKVPAVEGAMTVVTAYPWAFEMTDAPWIWAFPLSVVKVTGTPWRGSDPLLHPDVTFAHDS